VVSAEGIEFARKRQIKYLGTIGKFTHRKSMAGNEVISEVIFPFSSMREKQICNGKILAHKPR